MAAGETRQTSAEIEVTPEMIAEGVFVLEEGRGAYHDEMLVAEVYTAMRRAALKGQRSCRGNRLGPTLRSVGDQEGSGS
jgi:hypothetical protein